MREQVDDGTASHMALPRLILRDPRNSLRRMRFSAKDRPLVHCYARNCQEALPNNVWQITYCTSDGALEIRCVWVNYAHVARSVIAAVERGYRVKDPETRSADRGRQRDGHHPSLSA